MEHQLERRLRFNSKPEHSSLYKWAINEIDATGSVVGHDQIPWVWNLAFTATTLSLIDSLEIKTAGLDAGHFEREAGVSKRRRLHAILRTGEPRFDGDWLHQTTYRMFGSDRVIADFSLSIYPFDKADENEEVTVYGSVQYVSDIHFRDELQPDVISFSMFVHPATFEHYAQRVVEKSADELVLVLHSVDGFYAEWSPEVLTRDVKVLAGGREQPVDLVPEGIELPRLGKVGSATLYVRSGTSRREDGDVEPDLDAPARQPLHSTKSQVSTPQNPEHHNHILLASIRTGVWAIFAAALFIAIRISA